MCGYAYRPDFLFTWPNAETGVMGGEQAARTMRQVMTNSAKRKGKAIDEKTLKVQEKAIVKHFDNQSNAFFTSGRMLDHGMIDPRDTRQVLGLALETCWESKNRRLKPNSFGIARM